MNDEQRYPDPPRAAVFDRLAALGAVRAVVEFSGGDDQGGADSVRLEFEDDRTRELAYCRGGRLPDYRHPDLPWRDEPDLARDGHLYDALTAPMDDRYGGFNNEPIVEGSYVWDVTARKVTLTAEEDWRRSDHVEEEV